MLTNKSVYATLPAVDLNRARRFYEEKLGLKVIMEDPSMGMWLKAGNGCELYFYQRGPTKADHTVAAFDVENIEAEVKELKSKGVKFEEYDMPEMRLKTVNGIATMTSPEGEIKSAWFKDSEGNILALSQMSKVIKEKLSRKMAAIA